MFASFWLVGVARVHVKWTRLVREGRPSRDSVSPDGTRSRRRPFNNQPPLEVIHPAHKNKLQSQTTNCSTKITTAWTTKILWKILASREVIVVIIVKMGFYEKKVVYEGIWIKNVMLKFRSFYWKSYNK